MNHIMRILAVNFVISLSFFLTSCDFSEIKSKATIGEISIEVDESISPLIPYLINEFQRLNPESKINYSSKPARNVITDFLNKDTRTIISAANFNEEDTKYISEYKIEMQRHEIAIDAVAFIVNIDNPTERLTSEDLRKIFTGEFIKWSQIKVQDNEQNIAVRSVMAGKNDNIKVFIHRPNSSLYSFVKDSVLLGADYIKSAQICSTSTQMLEMVRENKNSIGISNLCWLARGNQDSLDASVKPLRISKITSTGKQYDFVQLHQGYVFSKQYPYIRQLTVYTLDLDIGLSTGWITFLLNKDGQKIILERGLVPVSQPVRLIKLE